jgi:hypothetical protein
MYRVIAIVCGGLALAACSSMNLDIFKSGPTMETVRFESEPPGADVKVSSGQTCRTPCALALADPGPYAVTFTLNGFQPDTEQVEMGPMGDDTEKLRPNPVLAALTPTPPPPKPVKKKPMRRRTIAKPAARPAAQTRPAPSAAPQPMAPAQQQAPSPSPWPTTPAH